MTSELSSCCFREITRQQESQVGLTTTYIIIINPSFAHRDITHTHLFINVLDYLVKKQKEM